MRKLIENFFYKVRTEGWMKAFFRIYTFSKQNKYLRLFFEPIYFVKYLFSEIMIKIKRRRHNFNWQKRIKNIKISKTEARVQINELIDQLKDNNVENLVHEPLVSIIILNRNGIKHLTRLMRSLRDNTNYSNYEIIIIDNASSDGSVDFLEANQYNLPIKLIKNKKNVSFSRGCNQGSKIAQGELFVFMNNDIQLLPGWLGNLVDCYVKNKKTIGSIGAKLIYPEQKNFKLSNRLQHVGIKFEFDPHNAFYRPYNFGVGESVLNHMEDRNYPALTAALLMVPRDKFEEVGKFDESYFYGYEDIDLGLKLTKCGYRNVFCAKSCAFHYEFGTQEHDDNTDVAMRRRKNMEIFKKKWHLFLVRNIFKDRLEHENFYCEEKLQVSIVLPRNDSGRSHMKAKEFVDIVKCIAKWQLKVYRKKSYNKLRINEKTDLIFSFDPDFDIRKMRMVSPKIITVACVGESHEMWQEKEFFPYYDFIVTGREIDKYRSLNIFLGKIINIGSDNIKLQLQKIISHVKADLTKRKLCIKIPAPHWHVAENWGDYYFALSIAKYVRRKNWSTRMQVHSDWHTDLDRDCDAVLVIRGLERYYTKKKHFNVMWNISHPDMVSDEEYIAYDHVFIASDYWAEKIRKKLNSKNIQSLLQCTDHEIFNTPHEQDLSNDHHHTFLFVGNSLRRYRISVKYAIENNLNIDVYGPNWSDFIDKKYMKSDFIPNEELHKHYYNAKILLNDHWKDMAEKGFISNRIFDALASGAVLLTDRIRDCDKNISRYLSVYQNKDDFSKKINLILSNHSKYKKQALEAREFIVNNHSFEKRISDILEVIEKNIS